MPCEICGITYQHVGKLQSGQSVFWCPSCGTLKTVAPNTWTDIEAPKIVHWMVSGAPYHTELMAKIRAGDGYKILLHHGGKRSYRADSFPMVGADADYPADPVNGGESGGA
jgi:hypothetical protein